MANEPPILAYDLASLDTTLRKVAKKIPPDARPETFSKEKRFNSLQKLLADELRNTFTSIFGAENGIMQANIMYRQFCADIKVSPKISPYSLSIHDDIQTIAGHIIELSLSLDGGLNGFLRFAQDFVQQKTSKQYFTNISPGSLQSVAELAVKLEKLNDRDRAILISQLGLAEHLPAPLLAGAQNSGTVDIK